MIGERFNRLVVIEKVEKKYGKWIVKVKCDCGSIKKVYLYDIQRGKVKSCGCLNQELRIKRATSHGMKGTKIYTTWKNIRNRCHNKNNPQYHNYGGRGIKICERWNNFQNFYDDMGDIPEGKSIDRIDNDGDYSPDNCKWSTYQEQAENKGKYRNSKTGITGVTITHQGFYRSYIDIKGKRYFLYHGDNLEQAINARKEAERSRNILEITSKYRR